MSDYVLVHLAELCHLVYIFNRFVKIFYRFVNYPYRFGNNFYGLMLNTCSTQSCRV